MGDQKVLATLLYAAEGLWTQERLKHLHGATEQSHVRSTPFHMSGLSINPHVKEHCLTGQCKLHRKAWERQINGALGYNITVSGRRARQLPNKKDDYWVPFSRKRGCLHIYVIFRCLEDTVLEEVFVFLVF